MPDSTEIKWKEYMAHELSYFEPKLKALGFSLEKNQPHTAGERYLMQAVTTTSGKKLILLGKEDTTDTRVVIKVSTDPKGIKEIQHEHTCKKVLEKIQFAYEIFVSPPQVFFEEKPNHIISIQKFIEQKTTFTNRPVEEQFALALSAFKAQESARATTYGHEQSIQKAFERADVSYYLKNFKTFKANILLQITDPAIEKLLIEAENLLIENAETIDRYRGFLTHTDFVPHNIRIATDTIYLLDHSSLRFGNKYEGWARFINFMALYNPELEEALLFYIRENRVADEYKALQLMRVYRLGEIIWYYTRSLPHISGDLLALNTARVHFWSDVLASVLKNEPLEESVLEAYKNKRDSLRSEEEKERQKELH